MQIPKSILEPFGYTGVPTLSRESLENELANAIREITEEIDRRSKEERDRYMIVLNPFMREAVEAVLRDARK